MAGQRGTTRRGSVRARRVASARSAFPPFAGASPPSGLQITDRVHFPRPVRLRLPRTIAFAAAQFASQLFRLTHQTLRQIGHPGRSQVLRRGPQVLQPPHQISRRRSVGTRLLSFAKSLPDRVHLLFHRLVPGLQLSSSAANSRAAPSLPSRLAFSRASFNSRPRCISFSRSCIRLRNTPSARSRSSARARSPSPSRGPGGVPRSPFQLVDLSLDYLELPVDLSGLVVGTIRQLFQHCFNSRACWTSS